MEEKRGAAGARQESNLYCELRKLVSYPLEDGRTGLISEVRNCSCLSAILHCTKRNIFDN